jgi:plastocyanin
MAAWHRREALAALVAGVGVARLVVPARAAETAVSIDNFAFSPATLRIPAGTRIVWTNRDDIPHTVTSAMPPRLFHSGPLDTDDSFGFTFATPGTVTYFCALHPHMQGTVIVT